MDQLKTIRDESYYWYSNYIYQLSRSKEVVRGLKPSPTKSTLFFVALLIVGVLGRSAVMDSLDDYRHWTPLGALLDFLVDIIFQLPLLAFEVAAGYTAHVFQSYSITFIHYKYQGFYHIGMFCLIMTTAKYFMKSCTSMFYFYLIYRQPKGIERSAPVLKAEEAYLSEYIDKSIEHTFKFSDIDSQSAGNVNVNITAETKLNTVSHNKDDTEDILRVTVDPGLDDTTGDQSTDTLNIHDNLKKGNVRAITKLKSSMSELFFITKYIQHFTVGKGTTLITSVVIAVNVILVTLVITFFNLRTVANFSFLLSIFSLIWVIVTTVLCSAWTPLTEDSYWKVYRNDFTVDVASLFPTGSGSAEYFNKPWYPLFGLWSWAAVFTYFPTPMGAGKNAVIVFIVFYMFKYIFMYNEVVILWFIKESFMLKSNIFQLKLGFASVIRGLTNLKKNSVPAMVQASHFEYSKFLSSYPNDTTQPSFFWLIYFIWIIVSTTFFYGLRLKLCLNNFLIGSTRSAIPRRLRNRQVDNEYTEPPTSTVETRSISRSHISIYSKVASLFCCLLSYFTLLGVLITSGLKVKNEWQISLYSISTANEIFAALGFVSIILGITWFDGIVIQSTQIPLYQIAVFNIPWLLLPILYGLNLIPFLLCAVLTASTNAIAILLNMIHTRIRLSRGENEVPSTTLVARFYWITVGNLEPFRIAINEAITGTPNYPLPFIWNFLIKFFTLPALLAFVANCFCTHHQLLFTMKDSKFYRIAALSMLSYAIIHYAVWTIAEYWVKIDHPSLSRKFMDIRFFQGRNLKKID